MCERSDLVRTYGLDTAAIERLMRVAARFAYDCILVTSAQRNEEGHPIVFVNSAVTELTGYTEDELIGQTAKMFQGPQTDRAVLDRLKSCLENGHDFHGQAINYKKNGSEYLLEWRIFPIRNKEGIITHYASIQRDVTPTDGAGSR